MLSGCINYGDVSGEQFSGGIVGESYYDSTDITYCVNAGSVTGAYAGGIAGRIIGAPSCISSCYTTKISNVKSLSDSGAAGGMVGLQSNGLKIYNSGNIGEVAATNRARRTCGDGRR